MQPLYVATIEAHLKVRSIINVCDIMYDRWTNNRDKRKRERERSPSIIFKRYCTYYCTLVTDRNSGSPPRKLAIFPPMRSLLAQTLNPSIETTRLRLAERTTADWLLSFTANGMANFTLENAPTQVFAVSYRAAVVAMAGGRERGFPFASPSRGT